MANPGATTARWKTLKKRSPRYLTMKEQGLSENEINESVQYASEDAGFQLGKGRRHSGNDADGFHQVLPYHDQCGLFDRLEVYDKEVVIKRKLGVKVLLQSLKGDLLEGRKGDKNIPIEQIASIQLKPASTLLAGHITIVLPESKEGFMLAGLDDCTVEFVKREEEKFVEIKAFLDARIGR